MPVPTTLQGTHDGCGGTVAFHPAIHQRELLAGESVVLDAACQSCGATLTMEWELPEAAQLRARAELASRLPIAAGAEQWQHATPTTIDHSSRETAPRPTMFHDELPAPTREAHVAPETETRPAPVVEIQTPPTRLGSWRLAEAQAEVHAARAPQEPVAPAPEDDPRMTEFLTQFTERIDRARLDLSRVSADLPSAIMGDGETLRRPMLARRPTLDAPASRDLASTPVAFASAAPEPAQPAPAGPAIQQPTFTAPPVEDAQAPHPVLAPVPTPPEPSFASLSMDAPLPAAVAHAVAEQAPLVAPAAPAATAVSPAPAVPAAFRGEIAPTDSDVFPPAAVAAPTSQPVIAGGPAAAAPTAPAPSAPAPDAAADVWGGASAMPALAVAPAPLAAPAPAPAPAPPMPHGGAVPPAPSFAAPTAMPAPAAPPAAHAAPAPTFAPPMAPPAPDLAAMPAPASMPAPAASPAFAGMPAPAPAPAGMPAPSAMPAPTGAPAEVAAPAAEPSFEQERGFDWGPEAGDAEPKRRGLRSLRGRDRTQEDALSMPGVSSFAVDADTAASLDAPPRRRSKLGSVEIFAIVVLAAIAGLAGVKVVSSRDAAPAVPPAVAPATSIAPPVGTPKAKVPAKPVYRTPAAKAAAKARAAKLKAAAAKKKTGTPVASSGALGGADAGTTPVATGAAAPAQVQATPADTAAVTSADAPATTPAARP